MSIIGIIPARYASTRFPGKPLAEIRGKSMIRRVVEQASKSKAFSRVVVATDDERIAEHVRAFGDVVMTRADHPSGTDRCLEALTICGEGFEYVVNIQGDEPFIQPEQIQKLTGLLDGHTELATLARQITEPEALSNPNVVKVVLSSAGEALYFSRSAIPFLRGKPTDVWTDVHPYYHHIGLYAYRSDVLHRIAALSPSPLEQAESLEQLRWLENGFRIRVAITDLTSLGVDTPEDLERADRECID